MTDLVEDVSPQSMHDTDHSDGLYMHTKRPQWGVAVMVLDKPGKRAYQFQDGQLRYFKKGFYGLLEEVDPPEEEAEQLMEMLMQRLEDSQEFMRQRENHTPLEEVYPFETQLRIFRIQYPEGFQGEAWRTTIRGEGAKRMLKRHRDAAIVAMQEAMEVTRLEQMLADGKASQIAKDALEVMSKTDLIGVSKAKTWQALPEHQLTVMGAAIHQLLHGKNKFLRRFDTWIQVMRGILDQRPGWRMATVMSALMMPDKEICVRANVMKKQAGSMAPYLLYTKRAQRKPYRNFRKVARSVKKLLEAEGLKPKDMLDVHDFMVMTLKPSAVKLLG